MLYVRVRLLRFCKRFVATLELFFLLSPPCAASNHPQSGQTSANSGDADVDSSID